MTQYQTGKNIRVAFKLEGTPGTLAGASGATVFRASPASGLNLKKANVQPTEFRSDGMTSQARHGSRSVDGEYMCDLINAAFEDWFAAVLRGNWTNAFTITQADVTSITTTANAIVAASGSFLTLGVRKGDVVRLTGHSSAGNNSRNLRVTGVVALTLSIAETLIVDATPDTTFTITVCKRLNNGVPLVPRAFTVEETYQDIDASEVFTFVRIVGVTLKFAPDATVQATFKCVGQDGQNMTAGSSPYFTSPTLPVGKGLVVTDGKVRVAGADAIDFTSFEVVIDLGGSTTPVIGSDLTPDVFTNNMKVTGTLTGLRKDMARADLFVNETEFDIHVMCVDVESEPKHFTAFYFGEVKVMGNSKGIGNDNALLETLPLNMGADEAGGASALTMLSVISSAP